jgi:dGTPase
LAVITQVVSPAGGHALHNRLTHALKVAQVGRRIAEGLNIPENAELIAKHGGLHPSVVEAAGLAHDLGHPPFGHIAEEELNARLRKVNEKDGYEGNAQSFRIVTRLEIRESGRTEGDLLG